jgi:hypothetical protein
MAAPTVDQLHAALIEVATFLEERSLPGADEVHRSAREVAHSDAHGARRYLDLNRGRAPLDIYFSPVNGNAANEAEANELQQRYDALSSRASALATALLHAGR